MGNAHKQGGWTISEVERLTGLPRRDIQRCCYSGKGGLGIVAPQDSTWGRRCYGIAEIAALYIVQLEKLSGASLPEISRKLQEQSAGNQVDVACALAIHAAKLEERRETITGQLIAAQALRIALREGDSRYALARFVERSVADQLVSALRELAESNFANDEQTGSPSGDQSRFHQVFALRAGWLANPLSGIAPSCGRDAVEAQASAMRALANVIDYVRETVGASHDQARKALAWAFDAPGIALAVELWLGAGSFEFIVNALR